MAVIDLTHEINEDMMTYDRPWHTKVNLEHLGHIDKVGRNTHKIVLGSHTGTHIDAPLHFIANGTTIDKLPLEILTGEARVLDFRDLEPLTPVTASMLEERLNGEWATRLLLCYGWDKYFGSDNFYKNFPYLTTEASNAMVENGVKLVGMDTCMPDAPIQQDPNGIDSPIHKILLEANVVIVEYLCNLDKLPNKCNFTALPLKLKNVDGSPARCIAVI